MNYFLEKDQHATLNKMAELYTQKYYNSKGNLVSGKLMLIGLNRVKLVAVSGGTSVNNNVYISCVFTRKPEHVIGYKTKISFTPHIEYFFNYDRIKEFCEAMGHDLKPKPEDMSNKDYMRHLYRRIRTFIGREVFILVGHKFDHIRDEYGDKKKKVLYYDMSIDMIIRRVEVISFHREKDIVSADEWNVLYNMFKNSYENLHK